MILMLFTKMILIPCVHKRHSHRCIQNIPSTVLCFQIHSQMMTFGLLKVAPT